MPQSLKETGKRPARRAWLPHKLLASLRYRLHGRAAHASPMPEELLKGIAPQDDDFRRMSFTFAVIALSAQVARAGGPLTRAQYIAFRDSFPLKGGMCGKIRSLFALACENPTPFAHYVMQVKYLFPKRRELFISLVERLFSIAAADGPVTREASHMLSDTAHMLELTPAEYADIASRYDNPLRAHDVLGISRRPKAGALKARYRDLMRYYHPDRFGIDDLSPEVELLLQLKSSEINEAYRALAKRAA